MTTVSMPALMKISGLLTIAEAAGYSGMGTSCVLAWIRNGSLPAVKLGPIWVIAEKELKEFLEARG